MFRDWSAWSFKKLSQALDSVLSLVKRAESTTLTGFIASKKTVSVQNILFLSNGKANMRV